MTAKKAATADKKAPKTTKKTTTKATSKKTTTKKPESKVKPAKKSDTEAKTKVISESKPKKGDASSNDTGKHYYFFGNGKAEGNASMNDLLGGKGANLSEMTKIGIPVPPGFVITTESCRLFYEKGMEVPKAVDSELESYVAKIEKVSGLKFGDPENPLLVSVRSGSKFSMPGMMDTILNLGLNDETVEGMGIKAKNMRFALDNYRRLLSMFGNVVLSIDREYFDDVIDKKKKEKRVKQDSSLQANDLKEVIKKFKQIIKRKSGEPFPSDPWVQLRMARDSVFRSWNTPRAISYRRMHDIPSDLGTAVNIQAMVFGNTGNKSASGVGFTRNPSTGVNEFFGEYLINAQGEDIVAGTRTPQPIKQLAKDLPKAFKQLKAISDKLEKHYRDVQDFEFTIQDDELFMLQTRNAKRTVAASLKIVVDMVNEKVLSKEEALLKIDPKDLDRLLHPSIDPKAKIDVITTGLAASPGAVSGKVYFTAEDTVKFGGKNKIILVREETNPDDIEGMNTAVGILTSRGGMTSHAAVVARGMGKTCVCGAEEIRVNLTKKQFQIGKLIIKEGEVITIDGGTGNVILGEVPTFEPELSEEFNEFMSWADKVRRLKVRANADTPKDAKKALKFGAEGIGLCRTEHMFFGEGRISIMQDMITADSAADRQIALDKLLKFQKKDFKEIFSVMQGYSVTIRTLDPPLHEFLPRKEEVLIKLAGLDKDDDNYEEDEEKILRTLRRIDELVELNPMLGHRGCRLGIMFPEITEMQVRAILTAAVELAKDKKKIFPEIMIPLVGHVNEFINQKEAVERTAREVIGKSKVKDFQYKIGTMIEVPRAAITADEIGAEADFFSFGTNDLTQMTLGFSRDDSGKFLGQYLKEGILPEDPFVTIDKNGVGVLIKMGIEKGLSANKDLTIGICGEHGGDPASIEFCNELRIDYVSCSPYRVPIARLAAAQAVLKNK